MGRIYHVSGPLASANMGSAHALLLVRMAAGVGPTGYAGRIRSAHVTNNSAVTNAQLECYLTFCTDGDYSGAVGTGTSTVSRTVLGDSASKITSIYDLTTPPTNGFDGSMIARAACPSLSGWHFNPASESEMILVPQLYTIAIYLNVAPATVFNGVASMVVEEMG